MFNLSNSLSLLRGPLAFLFLVENVPLRLAAVILAMISDSVDGYLARRSKSTSRFGAALDPIMDKFFVFFVLSVFLAEHKLEIGQIALMLSRDIALCLFALYLAFRQEWKTYHFHSVRWGKITTAMQFIVIILLTLNIAIPASLYWVFLAFGFLVFAELMLFSKKPAA